MTILIRGQTVELLLNGVPIALVSGFDTSFGYELTETPLLQKGHKHIDLSTFAAELSFNQLTVDAETMALALGYTEYTVDGKIKIIDTSLASWVEGRQTVHDTNKTKDCAGTGQKIFNQDVIVQGDRIKNMMLWINAQTTTAALKIENSKAPADVAFIHQADIATGVWKRYILYTLATGGSVTKLPISDYSQDYQVDEDTSFAVYLTRKAAQSFIADDTKIHEIRVKLNKVGTTYLPSGVDVRIESDLAGSPDGTILGSKIIAIADIATSKEWEIVDFTSAPITVVKGTKYWIVIQANINTEGAAGEYVGSWYNSLTDDFTEGASKQYDGSWTALDYDLAFMVKFKILLGKAIGDYEALTFSCGGTSTYEMAGDGTDIAYVMLFETDSHYTFKVKYLDQNGAVSFYLLIGDCVFNKDSISGTPGEPIIEDVTGIALDVEVGE